MQEPDIGSKANKIRAFLEKTYKTDLSRYDEDLIYHFYKYIDTTGLKMNFEDNSIPSDCTEAPDLIKELYKKTPLKKRPIQPTSFLPDETESPKKMPDETVSPKKIPDETASSKKMPDETIPPKPRVCPVPEGRVSKRKMFKPVKKIIETYVAGTSASELVPKAIFVPVIKTSEAAKTSVEAKASPVEAPKVVDMAVAPICESEDTEVPSKCSRISQSSTGSRRRHRKSLTKEEKKDYLIAKQLQLAEYSLRRKSSRRDASNVKVELGESSSANTENNSTSEIPKAVEKKQGKRKTKKIQNQVAENIEKEENDIPEGSDSQNMCVLSPELASIVGHKKEG